MYCIYVWRPIMEASRTLENIRSTVVSRWSQKVMLGWGGGGVLCISSTVGKYNIFVTVVIAVKGI